MLSRFFISLSGSPEPSRKAKSVYNCFQRKSLRHNKYWKLLRVSTILKAIVVVNGWIVPPNPEFIRSQNHIRSFQVSNSFHAHADRSVPIFHATAPVCNPEVNPGGSLGCFFTRTYYQEDGSYFDSPFSKMFLFTVIVTFVKLGQMN